MLTRGGLGGFYYMLTWLGSSSFSRIIFTVSFQLVGLQDIFFFYLRFGGWKEAATILFLRAEGQCRRYWWISILLGDDVRQQPGQQHLHLPMNPLLASSTAWPGVQVCVYFHDEEHQLFFLQGTHTRSSKSLTEFQSVLVGSRLTVWVAAYPFSSTFYMLCPFLISCPADFKLQHQIWR